MKKLLLLLLIALTSTNVFAKLSNSEIAQFYIGMKKSEVERILQKNAIRNGESFSLENFRITDLDELDMPPEITFDANAEAYKIGENSIIFENARVAFLSLKASDSYGKSSELIDMFISKYGAGEERKNWHYWLTNNAFILISKENTPQLDIIRLDLFPMHYLEIFKEINDDDIYGEIVDDYDVIDADSVVTIEQTDNKVYLPLRFLKKVGEDLTEEEVFQYLEKHLNNGESINPSKYKRELNNNDKYIINLDSKSLTKYDFGDNQFFFNKGQFIGLKVQVKSEQKELDILKEVLDKKYDGRKAISRNEILSAWVNDEIFITIEDYDNKQTVQALLKKYISEEALKEIDQSLTEVICDYSLATMASLDLDMSVSEVTDIFKKATGKPNFNFEINKTDQPIRSILNKIEALDITADRVLTYEWNKASFIFVDNKLRVFFIRKYTSNEKEYEATKEACAEKDGNFSHLERQEIVWITEDKICVLEYNNDEKISLATIDKKWIDEDELNQFKKGIQKYKDNNANKITE